VIAPARSRGSAITEFGPALFIFFIVIFFPLMDVLALSANYMGGWYFNYECAKQVSRVTQADGQAALSEMDNNFIGSGIGKFLGFKQSNIQHQLTYIAAQTATAANPGSGQAAINAMPPQVQVTTTLKVRPFLYIPFPVKVPGLNDDVPFQYSVQIAREETQ